MRYRTIGERTTINVNVSYEGETIEKKLQRITQTKEPIEATSPIIFTERDEGVLAETDIRTDRWEIAREAMDAVNKSQIAKRTPMQKQEKEGVSEPTQATSTE